MGARRWTWRIELNWRTREVEDVRSDRIEKDAVMRDNYDHAVGPNGVHSQLTGQPEHLPFESGMFITKHNMNMWLGGIRMLCGPSTT